MAYKPQGISFKLPKGNSHNPANKAVEGIVDVTKIAATGIVAVGVLGAVGAALKK